MPGSRARTRSRPRLGLVVLLALAGGGCHHDTTGDASRYSGAIGWFLEAEALTVADALMLTIELQGPVSTGQVRPVSSGVFIGQWGPIAVPNAAPAAVAVSADQFAARANDGSVSGTLEVLRVAPLGLRLDLTATSAAGDEIRMRGDMTAALRTGLNLCS
jgi:hypothetical protein